MKKIAFLIGTRPEAIKLSPIIKAIENHPMLKPKICVTGQHRAMLDQVLNIFNIVPDTDLNIMSPNQTLPSLTSKLITEIDKYLIDTKPDLIIVQGDTTTVLCASLAAFYNKITIGHVEAGLRTKTKYSPFPEEINRVLTSHLADFHFAPTKKAKDNLLLEAINKNKIFVTGNTVIDALFITLQKIRENSPKFEGIPKKILNCQKKPIVLITGHRRENFGTGFENICKGILQLSEKFKDTEFVYPVHLNPNVQEPVFRLLSSRKNIHLIKPLGYLSFIYLMSISSIILTDSGGVQEEAPSLGIPVLVMRENTERPEAVEMGAVKLIGTDTSAIIKNVSQLLSNKTVYEAMSHSKNPYGDGKASHRIVKIIENSL